MSRVRIAGVGLCVGALLGGFIALSGAVRGTSSGRDPADAPALVEALARRVRTKEMPAADVRSVGCTSSESGTLVVPAGGCRLDVAQSGTSVRALWLAPSGRLRITVLMKGRDGVQSQGVIADPTVVQFRTEGGSVGLRCDGRATCVVSLG